MLLGPLVSLYSRLFSVAGHLEGSQNNSTTITFDDIPTSSGFGNVPPSYNYLSFSSFSVLRPRDPALKWISPNDVNCAVSAPNALLGSRPQTSNLGWVDSSNNSTYNISGAYFSIANATSMSDSGLQPYFSLLSFNLKPLDAPPPGTSIYVKGYSHARKEREPHEWHVYFPAGYHLPFFVKMAEYSGETWSELYGVEITADFGEQALDWEFCIDDLEIMFVEKPQHGGTRSGQDLAQTVLNSE